MRTQFQFNKTTVSMARHEVTAGEIVGAGPKSGRVIGEEWRIIYAKDGRESVHLAFLSEQAADAAMDAIKAETDACSRSQMAAELMSGCPDESRPDHEAIVAALLRGDSAAEILAMPEADRWPETYAWLKSELASEA